ncbi:MAG TPA: hypothetical protein VLN74_01030, partial [Ilumatobacteraceae bacterium]|nr:hypothetical protein [Ilumatobacteraceae bacterium]
WQIVLIGPFAGAALGVVARWWMRLISDDPEFTWSGTIFIVLAFTVMGAAHGLAWAVRRAGAGRRWTTVARVVAAVLTLPIFTGAGSIMLPTVFGASVARSRTDWPKAVRVLVLVLAIPVPIVIGADLVGNGVTLRSVLGAVLMVATYIVIVRSMHAIVAPIDDGWRLRRSVKVLTAVATALLVLLAATSAVGIG